MEAIRQVSQVKVLKTENQSEHPAFRNQLILENIFAFCSVKNLKNYRLVSRLWRDSAIKSLRALAFVVITDDNILSRFLKFGEKNPTKKLHSNFRLEYSVPDIPSIHLFWANYFDQVKILELSNCKFPSVDGFKSVDIFCMLIFECCKNMHELTLDNVSIKNFSSKKGKESNEENDTFRFEKHYKLKCLKIKESFKNPISWELLLGNFPFIETFEYSGRDSLDEVFSAIVAIRKQNLNDLRFKNILINSLNVMTRVRNALGFENFDPYSVSALKQVLFDTNLSLANVSLTVSRNDAIGLREIVKAHGLTLKFLCIDSEDNSLMNFFEELIVHKRLDSKLLSNLQELELFSPVINSLAILRFTPNLRKLSIQFNMYDGDIIANTDLNILHGFELKTLRELDWHSEITSKGLHHLMSWMPNVEMLRMTLDNETFSLVCRGWSNLVTLNIFMSEVNESGLTGLDADDVEIVNRKRCNLAGRSITVPRANLSCLKHLRKFLFRGSMKQSPSLKICTIIFGIQHAPCLQEMVVKNYKIDTELYSRMLPHLNLKVEEESRREVRNMARVICSNIFGRVFPAQR